MAKNTKSPSSTAQEPVKSRKTVFAEQIKKAFVDACVCYSIIVLLISAIGMTMNTETAQYVIYPLDILALFPFALVIGFANRVLFLKKFQLWSRVLLHALLVIGSFTVYLLTIKQMQTSAIAYISVILVVIYVIVMAVLLTVLAFKSKKENENAEYTNLYSKKEDDK